MRWSRAASGSCLALALCLAGCATTGTSSRPGLEQRVRELQDEIYQLKKAQEEAEARIRLLERGQPAPPGGRAAGTVGGTVGGIAAPATDDREAVRAVPPEEPRREPRSSGASADEAWERAKASFDSVRYGEAIALLQDFVERYPADDRAAEGQYLVGEAFYAEANFPQAAVEFSKVVSGYPGSTRAPDALYKVGLSYYELGYDRNALEHLERLERAYPGSPAAAAAAPLRKKLSSRR